jgi:hypothetical protein
MKFRATLSFAMLALASIATTATAQSAPPPADGTTQTTTLSTCGIDYCLTIVTVWVYDAATGTWVKQSTTKTVVAKKLQQ